MSKIKLVTCAIVAATTLCAAQETPDANRLSDTQKQALEKAKKAMADETKTKTVAITMKLAGLAKNLDRNMLAEHPDAEADQKLLNDLAQAITEMVTGVLQTKIAADRELVKVLTPEQKKILLAEIDKADSNPDLEELIAKLFDKK